MPGTEGLVEVEDDQPPTLRTLPLQGSLDASGSTPESPCSPNGGGADDGPVSATPSVDFSRSHS
eukprot:CAMPEP_0115465486 /NCGR_PEP_ID=MMETSP0271-20121206/49425_1 /TAXON_ID=71861 /ORGANISM="Scrippsiella trochoidea, Strain CCMP3099" /LENGTH=63 /DNA_ID=CAMNT_0002892427 /DNA_START=481 /DNA_END=669 /DNA_ORIENTATION=-